MIRSNGSFRYKQLGDLTKGGDGFYLSVDEDNGWLPGCECQIDKQIPAKQIIGTDGQKFAYNYDIFIPKYFDGELKVNTQMMIVCDDGTVDEFAIKGIDNLNRRYIEVWG